MGRDTPKSCAPKHLHNKPLLREKYSQTPTTPNQQLPKQEQPQHSLKNSSTSKNPTPNNSPSNPQCALSLSHTPLSLHLNLYYTILQENNRKLELYLRTLKAGEEPNWSCRRKTRIFSRQQWAYALRKWKPSLTSSSAKSSSHCLIWKR